MTNIEIAARTDENKNNAKRRENTMTKLENYFFVKSHPMGFFSVVVNPPKNEDNDSYVKPTRSSGTMV